MQRYVRIPMWRDEVTVASNRKSETYQDVEMTFEVPGDDQRKTLDIITRIREVLDDVKITEVEYDAAFAVCGRVSDLKDLPAVRKHGRGVSSAELAEFHQALADLGKERFVAVGSKQYETLAGQKFEGMSRGRLVSELVDEILDVQNYCTMLAIKAIAAFEGEK